MSSEIRTGRIRQVIRFNGRVARVRLQGEEEVTIPINHRPKIGDYVVENELSCECCKK